MVHYRRDQTPGGTWFFTVTLRDRSATTLTDHIDIMRTALRTTRRECPFHIDALVVLPDHLHAIWTLPSGDADYSGRWRAIKSRFVRGLRSAGVQLRANERGEHGVWQRRFWEHRIRDDEDMRRHVDYIHVNPQKHGLVSRVRDWPGSTFHRFVKRGDLPADWAGCVDPGGKFGE